MVQKSMFSPQKTIQKPSKHHNFLLWKSENPF